MADPTPSTFLQALRVLSAALMSALIVLLVAASVVLAGKDATGSTPIWAFAVLAVVAVADVVLIPLVGYRFKPIAPGTPEDEAERRAWATVNKETGGGKLSGSGRGKKTSTAPSKKGGKLGGKASASRTPEERSASAKKAAATRKRNREAKAQG